MTSVALHPTDRQLLEAIAEHEGAYLGDVWRRALHVYARQLGLEPPAPDQGEEARAP